MEFLKIFKRNKRQIEEGITMGGEGKTVHTERITTPGGVALTRIDGETQVPKVELPSNVVPIRKEK